MLFFVSDFHVLVPFGVWSGARVNRIGLTSVSAGVYFLVIASCLSAVPRTVNGNPHGTEAVLPCPPAGCPGALHGRRAHALHGHPVRRDYRDLRRSTPRDETSGKESLRPGAPRPANHILPTYSVPPFPSVDARSLHPNIALNRLCPGSDTEQVAPHAEARNRFLRMFRIARHDLLQVAQDMPRVLK